MDEREISAREWVVVPPVFRRRRDGAPAAAAAAPNAESDDDAQSEPGVDDGVIGTNSSSRNINGSGSEEGGADGDDDDPSEAGDAVASSNGGSNNVRADDEEGDDAFSDGSTGSDSGKEERSEDEEDTITVSEATFREAAFHLEQSEGPPIKFLCVYMPSEEERNDEEIRNDAEAREFRRLVTALGRGEGRRTVREIEFCDVDWHALPEEDVERLLVEALPAHSTLKRICFSGTDIPARYVRLLTSSLPTENVTPLEHLQFLGQNVDHESAQAIADMIRRNVALEDLDVEPRQGEVDPDGLSSGGLDANDCKLICQAVSCNTKLRSLYVKTKEVFSDTMDGAASSSSLRHLLVASGSAYPDGSVASVAQQLRVNTTMEGLYLFQKETVGAATDRPERFRPIQEVLETFNFTLRVLNVGMESLRWHEQESVAKLLRRNGQIQRALEQLKPQDYPAFRQLLEAESRTQAKKRGRPNDDRDVAEAGGSEG
jgi:hypothetical protein